MAQNGKATFEDVFLSNEVTETVKDEEVVRTRITKMTAPDGGVRHWMSAAIYVENGRTGYTGWASGSGLRFDSPDQIDAFIEQLDALRDEWKRLNLDGRLHKNSSNGETVKLVRKGGRTNEPPKTVGKPIKRAAKKAPASRRRVTS